MRTLILILFLSGCNLAHLTQDVGLSSSGAVIGSIASGPVGAASGAAIGSVVSTVLDPLNTQVESTTEVLEAIPEEDRAKVLKNRDMWETIESLGWYAGLIFVLFWLIPDPFTIIRRLLWK